MYGSPPGMSRLTLRNMDNFKFLCSRMHYDNSPQNEIPTHKYERLRRNDLTNCEILRTCTPFNSKAAQILQNKSEERSYNQSRLTVCDRYGSARFEPLTVAPLKN